MPTVPLHPRPLNPLSPTTNPLPNLLHTPSGLALLELQGTFHFPTPTDTTASTEVGKLVFPLYDPANDPGDTKWMKRVYLYVGKGQRMSGECKKLGKPLAVVRKRASAGEDVSMGGVDVVEGEGAREIQGGNGEEMEGSTEELEIVEVVRYRIVFSSRPEPVSGGEERG